MTFVAACYVRQCPPIQIVSEKSKKNQLLADHQTNNAGKDLHIQICRTDSWRDGRGASPTPHTCKTNRKTIQQTEKSGSKKLFALWLVDKDREKEQGMEGKRHRQTSSPEQCTCRTAYVSPSHSWTRQDEIATDNPFYFCGSERRDHSWKTQWSGAETAREWTNQTISIKFSALWDTFLGSQLLWNKSAWEATCRLSEWP